MEDPVNLQPKFIYGFTSSVRGGAKFVDDDNVVYSIGRVLAFHTIKTNKQKYVRVKDTYKINALTISPNRKVVAVAITGQKPAISIYDTTTLKRLVTLGKPAEGLKTQKFDHIAFTQDSSHLITVTSEPDIQLVYYKWESGGVVSYTKADGKPNTVSSTITAVAPHPANSSILAVGGIGIFRLMSLYYNEWRQYGFKRAEYWPISGLCWITPELILVGTRDGRLMVIEESLMKGEFKVQDLAEFRISEKEELKNITVTDLESPRSDKQVDLEVRGLVAFSQGFAFAYLSGEIVVFQKVDKRRWIKKNVIRTNAPQFWQTLNTTVNFIKHIDISPSESMILCTSSSAEVYVSTTFHEQDSKLKKPQFELIHNGYHYGPVATISTCLFKPHFLSVGASDRTCRIWNFETLQLVNTMTFLDDILTAAFHPSGSYILIAFERALKLFMILMDGMKEIASIAAENSTLICYSKLGGSFACLDGSLVQVYAFSTFEKQWEFKSFGSVTCLHFTANDFALIVVCLEGNVVKYCLKTGVQLISFNVDTNLVHGLSSSCDGTVLYIVGADAALKVYKVDDSCGKVEIILNENLNQSVLHCVTVACEDKVLLVGSQKCTIVSVLQPVEEHFQTLLFKFHSNPVCKLEVTHVNPTLVSLGRDGVIVIWKLTELIRKPSFLKYYREVDEVIVNSENWSNKKTIIKEQQEIMARLDQEYDEKLKLITADRETEEAKISGRYQGVLDIISLNNKISKSKNATEIEKMKQTKNELIVNFDKELNNQRVHFEQRLRDEEEELERWWRGWDNVKYGFDNLLRSVNSVGQCIAKRLEYFSAMELTRRVNEALFLKDEIIQIIEEQKLRELNLIKQSHIEIDELVENSERHEDLAVDVIELRNQKYKLCAQVEGLESTYYNMQEFLREAQKTITGLDHRKSQRNAVISKQRKIADKLEDIRESGKDILDNIEISKGFRTHHMVSEECIENLCQLDPLLLERKQLKKKEQWLRKELVDSTRSVNRLRYVLSFMSLQNYLHNYALQKNMRKEKDKNRKMHFFRTNLKKEIHSMLCNAESGNLKVRLINLCSQYSDPKADHFQLLDKLSGNNEFWKGLTHLEATKLHFGKCRERMKMKQVNKLYTVMTKQYIKGYDDDVDWEDMEESRESVHSLSEGATIASNMSKIYSKRRCPKKDEPDEHLIQTKKDLGFETTSLDDSTSSDSYHSSDDESSSNCNRPRTDAGDPDSSEKLSKIKSTAGYKRPLSVLLKQCKTASPRAQIFSGLLEEKRIAVARLFDLKRQMGHQKKMKKYGYNSIPTSERTAYKKLYSLVPMNVIIKALKKEIVSLSKSQKCQSLANEMFPHSQASLSLEPLLTTSHLCSMCRSFEMFTKFFDDEELKPTSPVLKLKGAIKK